MDVETRLKKHCNKQFSKWDIDLSFGEQNEEKLVRILKYGKIEVKTERDKWKDTGNIAIELYNHNKKAPSGLSVTKANYWATILVDDYKVQSIHILPVSDLKERVKEIVRSGKGRLVMGGDFKASEIALIPIKEIFGYEPSN